MERTSLEPGTTWSESKPSLPNDQDGTLSEDVSSCGMDWVTIPPRAPHFGGLWEAAAESMKHHLRQVIGQQVLSFEELNTILVHVEDILNSRPLTAALEDPNDFRTITPAHFLTGGSILEPPELRKQIDKSSTLSQRLSLLNRLKEHFWKSWRRGYLSPGLIRCAESGSRMACNSSKKT